MPVAVTLPSKAVKITAGWDTSCAILDTGVAYCWGYDGSGQLGTGATSGNLATPTLAFGGAQAVTASMDQNDACILEASGVVGCAGANLAGQVGNGGTTTSNVNTITSVLTSASQTLIGVDTISVGMAFGCAVRDAGDVQCWGDENQGELGGNRSSAPYAGDVPGITNAKAVAAGTYHACALLADSTVRCWGAGAWGQLGDGNAALEGPVSPRGLANVVQIAAASVQSCARLVDGTVWCWGANSSGLLGDGTDVNRFSPVQVQF